MSSETSSRPGQSKAGGGGGGGGGGAGATGARVLHPRSFKLRFATPREPGRSDVSLVKPLGLPATVAGKWYAPPAPPPPPALELAARRAVDRMFAHGPTDKYPRPLVSSHEYGWWWRAARPLDKYLRHHIRDSPWMKERLRLLPPPPAPAPAPAPRR